MSNILNAIIAERARQDKIWGEQNHDDFVWLSILSEEIGEIAKAMLEANPNQIETELTQAGAVIVAWLECKRRNHD